MQYFPVAHTITLPHPSHLSMITLQLPPLNPQPFFIMKPHSMPFLIV
jgi:hypothetical protein